MMGLSTSNIESNLLKISSIIHDSQNLNIIFEELADIIESSWDIKNYYVALLNRELDLITFPYYNDIKDQPPKEKFSKGKGITNYALKLEQELLINSSDYKKLVKNGDIEAIGSTPSHWLGVPLKDFNQVTIGLIVIQNYDSNISINQKHVKIMRFISEQLALAIDRFQHIKEVEHLTYYDPLTELPNKSLFYEHGSKIINENRSMLSCFFIDIDNFMIINDTYGDYLSNQIIEKVSYNLSKLKSDNFRIYYWGADKFTVIASDCKSIENIKKIVSDLKNNVCTKIKFDNKEINITCSIGVSVCPIHSDNIYDLCRDADIAMHQAKENGKNQFFIFEEYMKDVIISNYGINEELKEAVMKKQWEIYYQPQINSNKNDVIGFEALIRWKHPEKGLLMPSVFIPTAESTNCIFNIGKFVVRNVIKQVSEWNQKYHIKLTAAINLSPREFERKNLVSLIEKTLREFSVSPELIVIEITESTFLADNINQMKKLKDLGLKISIDDFGTGYSSLSYLHEYPIDSIKIDKSFVRNINSDNQKKVLSNSIINLANNLNLDIVTEGIEEQKELDFFISKECSKFQGYFFSRPLPKKEFESLLIH
ncbi:MAG: hypothetical protein CBD97_02625 [Pelagibacteraceae bacterium TMED237]|nr:hypothetical protein [Candidatus Neomarinimicrobiota bacterium]OUW95601.1 MAG: hypothetical protein CBD97_02625 [Pelagibacteraceae bacterium TMED237]